MTNPADWPVDGPIDLSIHDLPHATSTIEWWYLNCHFTDAEKNEYSLFASFFRKMIDYNEETKKAVYAHSITWAITDMEAEEYYPNSIVDKRAPKLGLEKLKKGELVSDSRMRKAAVEMLEKGNVPYPDRLFKGDVTVAKTGLLALNYDGNKFSRTEDGNYHLDLWDEEHKMGCKLEFSTDLPPVRNGENGVVHGAHQEDMFYYFRPNCKVRGSVAIKDKNIDVQQATGWYDHEFGCPPEKTQEEKEAEKDIAWNWFSIQLTNGYQLTGYDLFDNDTGENTGKQLIIIDPKGSSVIYKEFTLEAQNQWTSSRTFLDYPTKWKLTVPYAGVEFYLEAPIDQQEFATVISKPAFWEGRVNVKGVFSGEEVSGPGFVERSGFMNMNSMEDFFGAVSKQTKKSIEQIFPLEPSDEKLTELVSRKGNTRLSEGIDKAQYTSSLMGPIREILDRGGKSWRSYAALACCDIVGGNSQKAIGWLALPELIHVGSMIVDDVEDRSSIRRGGPACHVLHGEPIAINAGSACYFLGEIIVDHAKLEDKQKVQIYKAYFDALRAAHTGQALDLAGLDYLMPEIIETGNGKLLEERVISIHRLKTAAPASYLAQMGSVVGGGTETQSKALGDYFEAIGIAFQIIDDVLNLKGFADKLKSTGEDVTAGKITSPIAKAMSRLNREDRKFVWDQLQKRSEDETVIASVIEKVDACGALEDCEKDAFDFIEKAWKELDAVVRDSMVKLNLRAFSWFVLERQY